MPCRLAYFPCQMDENWRWLERLAGVESVFRLWPERMLPRLGPVVLVSPQDAEHFPGETNLAEFDHPALCTYVFGPNHRAIDPRDIAQLHERPARSVWIDGGEYLASHAAAIVIHDRVRRGRS